LLYNPVLCRLQATQLMIDWTPFLPKKYIDELRYHGADEGAQASVRAPDVDSPKASRCTARVKKIIDDRA
jgi:hypothetical protein